MEEWRHWRKTQTHLLSMAFVLTSKIVVYKRCIVVVRFPLEWRVRLVRLRISAHSPNREHQSWFRYPRHFFFFFFFHGKCGGTGVILSLHNPKSIGIDRSRLCTKIARRKIPGNRIYSLIAAGISHPIVPLKLTRIRRSMRNCFFLFFVTLPSSSSSVRPRRVY